MASTTVKAVQYIRKMRGGAQSQLLKASDGHAYVVKHQSNPQSVRVLANDMLATRIGRLLGLPMPDVAVIEVSDALIAATPELCIENAGFRLPWRAGRQFGSRHTDSPLCGTSFDCLDQRSWQKVVNTHDLARAIVFDKWTGNTDSRQVIFTRNNRSQFELTLIDNGYCFNADEWSFPDLALHGVYYKKEVYEHVTGWESFEPALTRAEQMDINDLWHCAQDVPEEWYEYDHAGLIELVDTLYQRRSRIRDLITAFRESSRQPFPNWKDKQLSLFESVASLSA